MTWIRLGGKCIYSIYIARIYNYQTCRNMSGSGSEATRHAQVVQRRLFFCFNRTAPRRISTRHRRFHGAKEMRETRRRLGACVRVCGGHFDHEF